MPATKLPAELERKMGLLKSSQVLPAPSDAAKREELTQLAAELEGMYGRGKYCPPAKPGECMDIGQLSAVLTTSRDPKELEMAWAGWHSISRPMRGKYQRFVELANEGAKELGYADLGELWRSNYDMAPDAFAAELDRLWGQVKPLYDSLHCYVRARLTATYGKEVVPPGAPDPGAPARQHVGAAVGRDLRPREAGERRPAGFRPHHAAQGEGRRRARHGALRRGLLHLARLREAAGRPSGSARCSPSRATATSSATPPPGTSTRRTTCASRCASRSTRRTSRPSTTSSGTTTTSGPTTASRRSSTTAPTTASTRRSATPSRCR